MLSTQFERHERPQNPDPARVAGHGDTSLFFGCRDLTPHISTSALTASRWSLRWYATTA
jgi:hypothetical protein